MRSGKMLTILRGLQHCASGDGGITEYRVCEEKSGQEGGYPRESHGPQKGGEESVEKSCQEGSEKSGSEGEQEGRGDPQSDARSHL